MGHDGTGSGEPVPINSTPTCGSGAPMCANRQMEAPFGRGSTKPEFQNGSLGSGMDPNLRFAPPGFLLSHTHFVSGDSEKGNASRAADLELI